MKSYFVLLLVSLASVSLSAKEPTLNCEIEVKYYHTTGATSVTPFKVAAKSEADCQKKSKLYKENTTPQQVLKKEVTVKWLEK